MRPLPRAMGRRRGASETRTDAERRARNSAEGVRSGALLPDAPTAHQHGPQGTERDAQDPASIYGHGAQHPATLSGGQPSPHVRSSSRFVSHLQCVRTSGRRHRAHAPWDGPVGAVMRTRARGASEAQGGAERRGARRRWRNRPRHGQAACNAVPVHKRRSPATPERAGQSRGPGLRCGVLQRRDAVAGTAPSTRGPGRGHSPTKSHSIAHLPTETQQPRNEPGQSRLCASQSTRLPRTRQEEGDLVKDPNVSVGLLPAAPAHGQGVSPR